MLTKSNYLSKQLSNRVHLQCVLSTENKANYFLM